MNGFVNMKSNKLRAIYSKVLETINSYLWNRMKLLGDKSLCGAFNINFKKTLAL